MRTVFLVTFQDITMYGSDNPVAVCRTREVADKVAAKESQYGGTHHISEWVVLDEEL